MTFDDLRTKYRNGDYASKLETLPMVPEGHIFDEALSVRRNREMVEEHNRKAQESRYARYDDQVALDRKFTEDSIAVLMEEYGFTMAQAIKVQNFVYTEYHSSVGDYITKLDQIGEMVQSVQNA